MTMKIDSKRCTYLIIMGLHYYRFQENILDHYKQFQREIQYYFYLWKRFFSTDYLHPTCI